MHVVDARGRAVAQVDKTSTASAWSLTMTAIQVSGLRLVQKKALGLFGAAQSPCVRFKLFGQSVDTPVSAGTGDHAEWFDSLIHIENKSDVSDEAAATATIQVEVFNAGSDSYASCPVLGRAVALAPCLLCGLCFAVSLAVYCMHSVVSVDMLDRWSAIGLLFLRPGGMAFHRPVAVIRPLLPTGTS
jgi:hypothetical protein